ncbi:1460_t:CDS:2 [Gigaspora margarita]|uniref:1460_t:CDS:1 n=1 Tax=Gigaspora margarita TaxID=4874 RepID=A0ABN7V9L2_GIGMA|nr:1460_t:CDS:2 [Gigaspora margarita]
MLQSNNSDSNTIKYINLQNGVEIEEISTYPLNNIIIYKERKYNKTIRSFTYIIKKEGVYPSHNILVTTSSPNKKLTKKIPNNYIAITTWGRGKNKKTIRCSIKYKDKKPEFIIDHGNEFTETVTSTLSASKAALIYLQACNPNSKATISGPLVFGLQLETLNKLPRKMGTLLQSSFNNEARSKYHIEDKVNLKSVDFSVDKYDYYIDFSSIQENQKIQSLVQTIDRNKILRDSYRNLTIDEPNLP